jgi:hypothetical protein
MEHHDLPPPPDFDHLLTRQSPRTASQRTDILALIGNLIFVWSNNESLWIYVLMLLLRTDKVSAALVFATLNTTRARLDLIRRLAKANLKDQSLAEELSELMARFEKSTKLRNSFNHCMYSVDESGTITHTSSMRVEERKGEMHFGIPKPLDARQIKMMELAIQNATQLNRDIWFFLPRLDANLNPQKKPS